MGGDHPGTKASSLTNWHLSHKHPVLSGAAMGTGSGTGTGVSQAALACFATSASARKMQQQPLALQTSCLANPTTKADWALHSVSSLLPSEGSWRGSNAAQRDFFLQQNLMWAGQLHKTGSLSSSLKGGDRLKALGFRLAGIFSSCFVCMATRVVVLLDFEIKTCFGSDLPRCQVLCCLKTLLVGESEVPKTDSPLTLIPCFQGYRNEPQILVLWLRFDVRNEGLSHSLTNSKSNSSINLQTKPWFKIKSLWQPIKYFSSLYKG